MVRLQSLPWWLAIASLNAPNVYSACVTSVATIDIAANMCVFSTRPGETSLLSMSSLRLIGITLQSDLLFILSLGIGWYLRKVKSTRRFYLSRVPLWIAVDQRRQASIT